MSTRNLFWAEIWKISFFLSENFHFLVVKFSVCLNRGVFVMGCSCVVSSLFGLVATCCRAFYIPYPLYCLIVVCGGSCLALWSPHWGSGSWWLCFSLANVCAVHGTLITLLLGLNNILLFFLGSLTGYILCLWHILDYFFSNIMQLCKE